MRNTDEYDILVGINLTDKGFVADVDSKGRFKHDVKSDMDEVASIFTALGNYYRRYADSLPGTRLNIAGINQKITKSSIIDYPAFF